MIWPLIWVQIMMLSAAIRRTYGKGVQYHWSVTPNGRVFLASIDWVPGHKTEWTHLQPAPHFNDRLAAACDGRTFTPDYLRMNPLSFGRGTGVRGKGISASATRAAVKPPLILTPLFGRTQCARLCSQAPGRSGFSVPLPET
ncbi:hypothetical protein HY11_09505 [Hyphomonas pacifica]|nr:hypothetical protein HY11_09505 [Hyphomonas pacifica]